MHCIESDANSASEDIKICRLIWLIVMGLLTCPTALLAQLVCVVSVELACRTHAGVAGVGFVQLDTHTLMGTLQECRGHDVVLLCLRLAKLDCHMVNELKTLKICHFNNLKGSSHCFHVLASVQMANMRKIQSMRLMRPFAQSKQIWPVPDKLKAIFMSIVSLMSTTRQSLPVSGHGIPFLPFGATLRFVSLSCSIGSACEPGLNRVKALNSQVDMGESQCKIIELLPGQPNLAHFKE